MIAFACLIAGLGIGSVIGAALRPHAVPTWDERDVIRPAIPTCTAIPSAWRKARWR